jgi:CubicO group peptidase (beta-lactamase class C family)
MDYAIFLAAWMRAAREGAGHFLDSSTVRRALADPLAADELPRSRYYGMHWEIYAPPATVDGLPAFGHRGATGTVGMAIPEQDAIVVFLTNSQESEVVEEVIGLALDMFGG